MAVGMGKIVTSFLPTHRNLHESKLNAGRSERGTLGTAEVAPNRRRRRSSLGRFTQDSGDIRRKNQRNFKLGSDTAFSECQSRHLACVIAAPS
jgi:hypothetical protein